MLQIQSEREYSRTPKENALILWFEEVGIADIPLVGGKNASLGGVESVLLACHKCFASLFTDRAISYRTIKGFDHFEVALSVGVQKMVRSDLASSGVMFSIDTETCFKNAALVTAAYGLGENVVQGAVNPDEYFVFKPTLREGFRPILEKRLGISFCNSLSLKFISEALLINKLYIKNAKY
jgi:phosphoenolpyruvate synthase/pyruvate phosphate dikinase